MRSERETGSLSGRTNGDIAEVRRETHDGNDVVRVLKFTDWANASSMTAPVEEYSMRNIKIIQKTSESEKYKQIEDVNPVIKKD